MKSLEEILDEIIDYGERNGQMISTKTIADYVKKREKEEVEKSWSKLKGGFVNDDEKLLNAMRKSITEELKKYGEQ